MSIGKLIAVAVKAAAKNVKAATPANPAGAAAKAAGAAKGADRTVAYTDKLGRQYKNGRAIRGSEPAQPAAPAKARTPKAAAPANERIAQHAARLRAAKTAQDVRAIVDSMRADKSLRVGDLKQIARDYSGRAKIGSKKEAIEAMAKRAVDNERTKARIEIAAKHRIL